MLSIDMHGLPGADLCEGLGDFENLLEISKKNK
jgi:hypothetical protein